MFFCEKTMLKTVVQSCGTVFKVLEMDFWHFLDDFQCMFIHVEPCSVMRNHVQSCGTVFKVLEMDFWHFLVDFQCMFIHAEPCSVIRNHVQSCGTVFKVLEMDFWHFLDDFQYVFIHVEPCSVMQNRVQSCGTGVQSARNGLLTVPRWFSVRVHSCGTVFSHAEWVLKMLEMNFWQFLANFLCVFIHAEPCSIMLNHVQSCGTS